MCEICDNFVLGVGLAPFFASLYASSSLRIHECAFILCLWISCSEFLMKGTIVVVKEFVRVVVLRGGVFQCSFG